MAAVATAVPVVALQSGVVVAAAGAAAVEEAVAAASSLVALHSPARAAADLGTAVARKRHLHLPQPHCCIDLSHQANLKKNNFM